MDHLQVLRSIFDNLVAFSDDTWQATTPLMTIHRWQPGERIINTGDRNMDVHFLIQGSAYYAYTTINGKERIKSFVKPGGVLTSMSTLIYLQPSPFNILTLESSITAAIRYTDIANLLETSSDWNLLYRKMLEQLVLKKEKREASLLLLSAQERYEEFLNEFGESAKVIPLNKIALYLGITNVALSRIRKQMRLTQVK